jgi:hypothetical protein
MVITISNLKLSVLNYTMKLLIIMLISVTISLTAKSQQHSLLGKEVAKNELKEALSERHKEQLTSILIKDKETAITIAELYLFKIYSKNQILNEKPYEAYLINGYWVINGTIPKGWHGGGFVIIINSLNGKVIKLTHYK